MSIFRIDNYLERWAQIFKPLSHDPAQGSKNKSFYRMDSIHRLEEFAVNLTRAKSPSLCVVTQMDGSASNDTGGKMVYTHRIFFAVRQEAADLSQGIINEVAAADAKAEGQELAQSLLAYMKNDKVKNGNKDLKALNMGSVAIITVPQKFNGWWFTELIIEHLIAKDFCVNPEDYHQL